MLLPLQGAPSLCMVNPGRCPGLSAFGPSARANIVSKNVHDFEHPTLLGAPTIGRGNPGRCPGLGAFGPSARANNDRRSWFPFGRRFSIWGAPALVQRICMILNTLSFGAHALIQKKSELFLNTLVIYIIRYKGEERKLSVRHGFTTGRRR